MKTNEFLQTLKTHLEKLRLEELEFHDLGSDSPTLCRVQNGLCQILAEFEKPDQEFFEGLVAVFSAVPVLVADVERLRGAIRNHWETGAEQWANDCLPAQTALYQAAGILEDDENQGAGK